MPYTPFHLPANALVAWPLRRRVDVPAFLLVNLAIDVEPALISLLDLGPPQHGVVHTLLGATLLGLGTGWVWWRARRLVGRLAGGPYPLPRGRAVGSAVAGGWLHVLLDAVMYAHVRPLWPAGVNPLHVPGSGDALHLLCTAALLVVLVLLVRARPWRDVEARITAALIALAALGMALSAALGVV